MEPSPQISNNELQIITENIYKLIHQRYILTQNGLQGIRRKFESAVFGYCPRFFCENQHLLPIGISSEIGKSKVCTWCPKCKDTYKTDIDLDGAYFGPSFPHFFLHITKLKNKIKFGLSPKFNYFGISIENNSSLKKIKILHSPNDGEEF